MVPDNENVKDKELGSDDEKDEKNDKEGSRHNKRNVTKESDDKER